jgi:hypothetical protein
VLEDILTRGGEPDLAPFLVEPFARLYPARFEARRRDLRIGIPSIEHLFGRAYEDRRSSQGLQVMAARRDAIAAAVSPEEVIDLLDRGEAPASTLAAVMLARGVAERHRELLPRIRDALSARARDPRTVETSIDGQLEVIALAPAAFGAYVSVLGIEPSAPPELAAEALANALAHLAVFLDGMGTPELAHARDMGRRFADEASDAAKEAAVHALDAQVERLLRRPTRNVEALEGILAVHAETMVLTAGASGADRMRERMRATWNDPHQAAAARYSAFRLLAGMASIDRATLLDDAVRCFMDETADPGLRVLLGGVITIWKPEAFERVVDMNSQPWTVRREEHAALPANNLTGNMPTSWLMAALTMAEHDEPHARVVSELVGRLTPVKAYDWHKVPAKWRALVGGRETTVRAGLRGAIERPEARLPALDHEARHVTGRHANAARLLALFGNEEDAALLAAAAGMLWVDRTPPGDVFWRPAGKGPALGKYSFLDIYLEVGFGTDGRYRILSEAYALAAERAEAQGEGGTASRFAYEAFLLGADNPRVHALLGRLKG